LLLGLAMARFGGGVAILATFLAGVIANAAGLPLHSEPFRGLGASGMVMGALGLLAVESFTQWRKYPASSKIFLRAAGGAIFILLLIGVSPGTDVTAHVGGFVVGALFGVVLAMIRPSRLQDSAVNLVCGAGVAALTLLTWWLALR
jgi:membrane associated rhomboid family serine protease